MEDRVGLPIKKSPIQETESMMDSRVGYYLAGIISEISGVQFNLEDWFPRPEDYPGESKDDTDENCCLWQAYLGMLAKGETVLFSVDRGIDIRDPGKNVKTRCMLKLKTESKFTKLPPYSRFIAHKLLMDWPDVNAVYIDDSDFLTHERVVQILSMLWGQVYGSIKD